MDQNALFRRLGVGNVGITEVERPLSAACARGRVAGGMVK